MHHRDATQTHDLDLAQLTRKQIDQKTWGRVHRLQAELVGNQLVIYGSVRSHYVKQLALKAALDALEVSPARNCTIKTQNAASSAISVPGAPSAAAVLSSTFALF